jgi:hypothetical protein
MYAKMNLSKPPSTQDTGPSGRNKNSAGLPSVRSENEVVFA